jgi:3-methyladenine DNA glycosylase AlkD
MKHSLSEIQTELRKLADKEIAEHSRRFFKTGKGQYGEGDVFLGIRVPVLRQTAKKYISAPLSVCQGLLKSKYHEERLFALILLVLAYKKADPDGQKRIYDFYLGNTRYVNNWDLVDLSAQYIVGDYLRDRDKKPLYQLAGSEDLWERRIAIISTLDFIRHNEFKDALAISELLLSDTHDLIHKAVGWMLREIGKRDLAAEEGFLKTHYKKMPRTMLRYAIEKFEEEKRKSYLMGRI